jgi:predicted negative regulator of RcsB-dependent stress response
VIGAVLSLKENVEMVREELNSEEKFFENAVKAERFVKKYKMLLIAGVVLIIGAVVGNAFYDAQKRSNKESANTALATLQSDPNNAQALKTLKSLNPDMYDLWLLSDALKRSDSEALAALTSSKAIGIADIAAYQKAVNSNDMEALESYSMRPDAIYKDLALFQLAVLLMENGRSDEGQGKLLLISQESPLYRYAQPLMHYGVK